MEKYTLNVHVAAPGTPLGVGGGATSLPGHMYYSISDGKETYSFGFAPVKHGDIDGPGKVYRTDLEQYQNPRYARTMEISPQQFKEIKEFGQDPASKGFGMEYKDARNNCVDFTWSALNRAGLHHTIDGKADRDHEGSLKPLRNVDDVQSIPDPVKGSPLNQEKFNPLPPRTMLQRMLSERGQEQGAEPAAVASGDPLPSDARHRDHGLYGGIEAGVRALDKDNGRSFDATSQRMSASLLALAKEQGLERVDHVLLSKGGQNTQPGENIFIVQGGLGDPGALRAHAATAAAAATPLETSWQRVEQLNAQQALTISQQPQLENQQRELAPRVQT